MKIAFVLGTRPEIIKISPIIKKLKKNQYSFIFTTQHYDYEMSQQFIEDLDMPTPDSIITLSKIQNSKFDRATQLGEIITNLSKILTKIKPDSVAVLVDTNTVLASALTSLKCQIPVSHIESGLRSHDWRMPEEHNRIVVDHISELLFTPTKFTQKNLLNENVHGKIHVTGNTSIDTIKENITKSEKLFSLNVDTDDFVLFTIHRGENVDNQKDLSSIISAIIESKVNVIFPKE